MGWQVTSEDNAGQQAIMVLEELRQAFVERYNSIGRYDLFNIPVTRIGSAWSPWFRDFDNAIDTLIANAVDPTDPQKRPWGDRSAILVDIGAERVPTPVQGDQAAGLTAWCNQQYQIFQRLTQFFQVSSANDGYDMRDYDYWGDSGVPWADAVADFNAMPWDSSSSGDTHRASHWSYRLQGATGKRFRIYRRWFKTYMGLSTIEGNPVHNYWMMTYYERPLPPPIVIPDDAEYHNADYPDATENTWRVAVTHAGPTTMPASYDYTAGLFGDNTSPEPVVDDLARGWSIPPTGYKLVWEPILNFT